MESEIRAHVERALHSVLDDQRHRWQAVSPTMSIVFDELETMVLSGGKRLRPQFLHWGWVAAGGDIADAGHHSFGAAIEMLHAFALFHDDVIDDAATRRGHETTHRRMSAQHHEDGLAGESRRHGEGVAVLVGDIAYSLSDLLMNELPKEARPFWNDLRLEMNVGQFLDTLAAAQQQFDVAHALTVARFKTAKYTIERPLHIGALAADAERGRELLGVLSDYGLALGAAFQLRDDILGAFGDETTTGKSVGGDFREGKPTVLISIAMQSTDPSHREVLDRIGDATLSTSDITHIQRVISDSGALAQTEEMITNLRDEALRSIETDSIDSIARENLASLAQTVTDRKL